MKNQHTLNHLDFKTFTRFYGYLGLLVGIITGILDVLSVRIGLVVLPTAMNLWIFFLLHLVMYVVLLYLGSVIFVLFYNWMAAKGKGIKLTLE